MLPNDMFGVAGYFANLMVCTPTWRRIGVKMYDDSAKAFLIFSKKMQEKHGGNPDLPVGAIEMLERGEITLEHDPNFIKAKATRDLLQYAWLTYHQDWTIIRNPSAQPFITSDNPVAIHQAANPVEPMTRFLPITPALCLSVRYDRTELPPIDPSMAPKGMVKWAIVNEQGAKLINKVVANVPRIRFSARLNRPASSCSSGIAQISGWTRNLSMLPADEPDAVYNGTIIRVRDMGKAATPKRQRHEV